MGDSADRRSLTSALSMLADAQRVSPAADTHLPITDEGRDENENETAAYTAGGVRGWAIAMLKKGSAKGTAKIWTKAIVTKVTASSVFYRALKRVRPNAFAAGEQRNAIASLGSPRRLWVRSLLGKAFSITAHATSGVALFGGYYWALGFVHVGDHQAVAQWDDPNPISAVLAGAAGGVIHAAVVQPLQLFQTHELSLGRLTKAERGWDECLATRGFHKQGALCYYRQRVLRCARRLRHRLPSAVVRDAFCFGVFFGTFAVMKTLCAPWLLKGSEKGSDMRLVAEAAVCGGTAGLSGHMVHGLVGRSRLRKPEYRHSSFKMPRLRVVVGGAPRATVAAAVGFGAAEAALLIAERWVHGQDVFPMASYTKTCTQRFTRP